MSLSFWFLTLLAKCLEKMRTEYWVELDVLLFCVLWAYFRRVAPTMQGNNMWQAPGRTRF